MFRPYPTCSPALYISARRLALPARLRARPPEACNYHRERGAAETAGGLGLGRSGETTGHGERDGPVHSRPRLVMAEPPSDTNQTAIVPQSREQGVCSTLRHWNPNI